MFNDWSVGVPGIMMIAWPDQWFHTSGDRVDKADPTQMKRVAVIGAAAAYTIASADDDMAIRIAAEIASNGARRLGHQFMVGLETLNAAEKSNFNAGYRMARLHVETAIQNEKATLETVLELANDINTVGAYITNMKKNIDAIGRTHLQGLETHMKSIAKRLGATPTKVRLTDLEKKATKIIPRQTSKVRASGYLGFRGLSTLLQEIPESERSKYPYDRSKIGSTSELQALINGKRSVLEIKNMLDVQYLTKSDVPAILNYLEILRLTGMVEW